MIQNQIQDQDQHTIQKCNHLKIILQGKEPPPDQEVDISQNKLPGQDPEQILSVTTSQDHMKDTTSYRITLKQQIKVNNYEHT